MSTLIQAFRQTEGTRQNRYEAVFFSRLYIQHFILLLPDQSTLLSLTQTSWWSMLRLSTCLRFRFGGLPTPRLPKSLASVITTTLWCITFFFVSLHPLLPLERKKKKSCPPRRWHTHTLQNSSTAFKIGNALSNREKTKKRKGKHWGEDRGSCAPFMHQSTSPPATNLRAAHCSWARVRLAFFHFSLVVLTGWLVARHRSKVNG